MNNQFIYQKGKDYSRGCFKNKIFSNFSNDDEQINFERSDFRGSKFHNLNLEVNFDRADLMGCSFMNINISNTNFGAPQFKNCIFENVKFTNNTYNATLFIKCSFIDCIFENESIYANITDCTFSNTLFSKSNFERSTIDDSKFNKCNFNEVNFSSLAAEDLIFEATHFSKVTMSINYFFSYFIDSDTNLDDITFEYRGSNTYLTEEVKNNYFDELFAEERFSELFNMCILLNNEDNLPQILMMVLSKKDILNYQLLRCIECTNFYFSKGLLSFETTSTLLNLLKKNALDFNVNNLAIIEKIYILEHLLTVIPFDKIKVLDQKMQNFTIKFRCSIDDEKEAEQYIEQLLKSVSISSIPNIDSDYYLINKQRGSWILTYLVASSLIIYCIKSTQAIISNNQALKKNNIQIRFIESLVDDSVKRLEHNQSIDLKSTTPISLKTKPETLSKILNTSQITTIDSSINLIDKITNIDISKIS